MQDHRLIDERSLAFDRLTAAKITEDPSLIVHARKTLDRWLPTASPRVRPVLLEWRDLVDGPREALLEALTGTDDRAMRLRQSSPFAGVLSPAERAAIIRQFQAHESSAA